MTRKVLSVGQCGVDHAAISRMLQTHFDVQIHSAGSDSEARNLIKQQQYDLILVNRLYDFDGSPGLPLVEHIKSDPVSQGIAIMLVSNFAEAQQEAIAAGAVMGFGKAELHHPDTISRLAEHLE